MTPWFSPFLYGGAVLLYFLLLRLWQPAGERARHVWRIAAMVVAVSGAYWLHLWLFGAPVQERTA